MKILTFLQKFSNSVHLSRKNFVIFEFLDIYFEFVTQIESKLSKKNFKRIYDDTQTSKSLQKSLQLRKLLHTSKTAQVFLEILYFLFFLHF